MATGVSCMRSIASLCFRGDVTFRRLCSMGRPGFSISLCFSDLIDVAPAPVGIWWWNFRFAFRGSHRLRRLLPPKQTLSLRRTSGGKWASMRLSDFDLMNQNGPHAEFVVGYGLGYLGAYGLELTRR